MKKSLTQLSLVISLCFLLCFTFGCQNQEAMAELEEMKAQAEVEEQNKTIVKQIMAAFEGLLAASEAGDADAYVSFVTDDAVMMYSGQPAVVGTEAIRAFVSDFFQQYRFDFTSWQSDEIQIAGDWAFHRYSGIAIITAKVGGDPVRLDRKYIDILRKEGASWRVSHHIFNLNE